MKNDVKIKMKETFPTGLCAAAPQIARIGLQAFVEDERRKAVG